jgi:hypothetical protein
MRGVRTVKSAWRNPLYAPKPRISGTRPTIVVTDEVAAERRAASDRLVARMLSDMENAATRRIADRDARIAVEGDTDLNHDNVEAAE